MDEDGALDDDEAFLGAERLILNVLDHQACQHEFGKPVRVSMQEEK